MGVLQVLTNILLRSAEVCYTRTIHRVGDGFPAVAKQLEVSKSVKLKAYF